MIRNPRRMTIVTLAAALAFGGCLTDLHLATSNLDIGPNPAFPGDTVIATFVLTLIPEQRHTVIVFVDDDELMRETNEGRPEIPVILELGDAADLIAEFGEGTHAVHVEVVIDSDRTRTQAVALELSAGAPGGS